MKKFIVLYFMLVGISSFAHNSRDIDEKVKNSFQSYFPDAKEVSWYENNEGYIAYFIDEGIQSRVLYPKDGSFVRLIRYYKEDHLPFSIVLLIRSKYSGKRISGVTEVSTIIQPENQLEIEYNVTAEDDSKLILLKIYENGSLGSVKKLNKAVEVNKQLF